MSKRHIDRGTLLGILLAAAGVIAGLLLDGGTLSQVAQPTAALIVLGGTLGAIIIQFPLRTLLDTAHALRHTLFEVPTYAAERVEQLAGYCSRARRLGILSLDAELNDIEDPFLRKALTLAVDGTSPGELRAILELKLLQQEELEEQGPRVLEAAAGFSPTLGIIGAVLGLIQVMQHLDNLGEIGRGIAVAFVSTFYGIGLANLLLFPLAGKLRIRLRERQIVREITLEAMTALLEGLSTSALRQRLEPYIVLRPIRTRAMAVPELISR